MNRDNLVWGILLILAGFLFMGNSLDIIDINVWGLIWPIGLIAFGLSILWGYFNDSPEVDVENLAIPVEGTRAAAVTIAYGAGVLDLSAGAEDGHILDARLAGGAKWDVTRTGDRANIKLEREWQLQNLTNWQKEANEWQIRLSRQIPFTLKVEGGASQTTLDLRDLLVRELDVGTGASQLSVTLPAGAGATKAHFGAGLAQLNITVPDGVAARIKSDSGLADINVDESRFPRLDKGYESSDYATAVNRVDIHLETGLGSVKVY
jgi:hypothetical protein